MDKPNLHLSSEEVDALLAKFYNWNGDQPAPKLTHWTSSGVIKIVLKTPRISSDVYFDGNLIGSDTDNPWFVTANIAEGKFDDDAGFKLSDIAPKDLAGWNNLGG